MSNNLLNVNTPINEINFLVIKSASEYDEISWDVLNFPIVKKLQVGILLIRLPF